MSTNEDYKILTSRPRIVRYFQLNYTLRCLSSTTLRLMSKISSNSLYNKCLSKEKRRKKSYKQYFKTLVNVELKKMKGTNRSLLTLSNARLTRRNLLILKWKSFAKSQCMRFKKSLTKNVLRLFLRQRKNQKNSSANKARVITQKESLSLPTCFLRMDRQSRNLIKIYLKKKIINRQNLKKSSRIASRVVSEKLKSSANRKNNYSMGTQLTTTLKLQLR